MAIYQRKTQGVHEGVWYYSLFVDGKRVQKSTGKTNKREAERVAALAMAQVDRGEYRKPVHILLSEFGQKYMSHATTHKRSWKRDEQMLRQLLAGVGDVRLGSITVLLVEEYQQKRNEEVSPATVNRELALLKHMLNLAERWDLYKGVNPVRRVKPLPEDNLKFQTVSEEEERKLLLASSPYLRELILFALNTGLRYGDLLKLKRKEVDLEAKRLCIVPEKNRRRRLDVPLNATAMEVLQARMAAPHGEYVFWNPATGDRFYEVKEGFKSALQRAGLSGITWHTFRHTFASRLLANGVDLVTVKELLGHSTIAVTMRYAHTNHDAKARAVATLGECVKTVSIVPRRWKGSQGGVSQSVSDGIS